MDNETVNFLPLRSFDISSISQNQWEEQLLHHFPTAALPPLASVPLSEPSRRDYRSNKCKETSNGIFFRDRIHPVAWSEMQAINCHSVIQTCQVVNYSSNVADKSYCLWTNRNFPLLVRRNASVTAQKQQNSAVPLFPLLPQSLLVFSSLQSRRALRDCLERDCLQSKRDVTRIIKCPGPREQ